MKTDKKFSPLDVQDKIRALIDMDEWKHSWHLPKDRNGYVSYIDFDTLRKCASILKDKAVSHGQAAQQSLEMSVAIEGYIERIWPEGSEDRLDSLQRLRKIASNHSTDPILSNIEQGVREGLAKGTDLQEEII